ncbi:endoplasmic reticulum-based factor for assembly of v-ATPase domain-containing protein [Ditylenchus destructor]|uniref:Endoplasmic reticulum-based factor for assembly of v-ATPase domain-containing protein n=1 Tax=Ditylenchus destructor TaxID=166010 RepID=A0AAD4N7P9_9BILA|nr:endoplasmic reticulum-based factor for assembly of v-ATPase domain-containing protein [Ditylenchus destructor]
MTGQKRKDNEMGDPSLTLFFNLPTHSLGRRNTSRMAERGAIHRPHCPKSIPLLLCAAANGKEHCASNEKIMWKLSSRESKIFEKILNDGIPEEAARKKVLRTKFALNSNEEITVKNALKLQQLSCDQVEALYKCLPPNIEFYKFVDSLVPLSPEEIRRLSPSSSAEQGENEKKKAAYRARIQKLRTQQENKEYMEMTKSIDPNRKYGHTNLMENFGQEMREVNRQVIAVVNTVITVGGAFAFGFFGVTYTHQHMHLDIATRILIVILNEYFYSIFLKHFITYMIQMKLDLFECVKRLHELELYEDLLLFAELNVSEHKLVDQLLHDEQAFIYMCIADANFSESHFSQSVKYYDKVIRLLALMKRQNSENHFEELLNVSEIRYRMHKALVRESKLDEAIRCLEAVPRAEVRPKILFAIAKLSLMTRRPNKPITPFTQKIINSLKGVAAEVSEALQCKSYLALSGNFIPEDDPMLPVLGQESRVWLYAKQAEEKHKFCEGAQALAKVTTNNFRVVCELAHFFHVIGDNQKALATYQRAHSIDPTRPEGMDVYASLLAQNQMKKELEALATKLMANCGQVRSEVFVTYGYLARLQRKGQEALQFAHKAVTLTDSSQWRQRAEALLLKAHVLLDVKSVKEADRILQQALNHDPTNIGIYETLIRSHLLQKHAAEALKVANNALSYLGHDNPRIQFLMALVLSEDSTQYTEAITILEDVTKTAPYLLDAISLLAKLYDKGQNYDKAIALLRKSVEFNVNAQLHRMLGDFLTKTNQPEAACSQYRQALSSQVPDPKALNAMTALNSIPGLATPECPANAVFNTRIPPVAPARARRTQTSQLHTQRRGAASTASSGSVTTRSASAGASSSASSSYDMIAPPRFDTEEGAEESRRADSRGHHPLARRRTTAASGNFSTSSPSSTDTPSSQQSRSQQTMATDERDIIREVEEQDEEDDVEEPPLDPMEQEDPASIRETPPRSAQPDESW